VGDLAGVLEKLDYLEWLGVDGIWLNPIMPSPDVDWGYDVSDYCAVHPALGSLDTFDELVSAADRRGMAIVLDVVPSHTSDRHPWFIAARASRQSPRRDYYVWQPPRADGSPPNNWVSAFGGPAWSRDAASGDYYLHNFTPQQPQLNWWNPDVVAEFDAILRFWFDRGVNGIRIDAVQALVHDPALRDNPDAGPDTADERDGQQLLYNGNHPRTHDVLRHWRRLADSYTPARLLFGETWFRSLPAMAAYYGNASDQLDLAWNVPFLQSSLSADALRAVVEQTCAAIPDQAWAAWAMSTHDFEGRAADRWCRGETACSRCALMMLLTLRGTPILYYGDELGMTAPPAQRGRGITRDRLVAGRSRDGSRGPMHWDGSARGGFTTNETPWLPLADTTVTNVEAQQADHSSTLRLVRDLLALRRREPSLMHGPMGFQPAPEGVLAWTRGNTLVAINLTDETRRIETGGRTLVAICTDRDRDGEQPGTHMELHRMQGAILIER
jgi:alpha-glucosidase